MHPAVELSQQLIAHRSVTPEDAGCQQLLAQHLQPLGFDINSLPFEDVTNLWARYGTGKPLIVFAGHTDVVPPGPLDQWRYDPFTPTIVDGRLYGRGATDMKSGIAAFVVAVERFLKANPSFSGSLALLITSDEEGPATYGTKAVVNYLKQQEVELDYCLVGEPSSRQALGDTIKIGRRGTLGGKLTVRGKQSHIAYPQPGCNPIHRVMPVLNTLIDIEWDQGNKDFQPTSFQLSNIQAGTGATNVIPGELEVLFNFRYSPESNSAQLKQQVLDICDNAKLDYDIVWRDNGLPFYTKNKQFTQLVKQAIYSVTGRTAHSSTSGGTSDGRFIAPLGCEIVELGVCNATIHQINEHVTVEEIIELTDIYQEILQQLALQQHLV